MNQEKDEISSGSLGGLLVPLWIQLLKQQQARCLGLDYWSPASSKKKNSTLKPGIGEHGSRCFLKHVPSLIHTPLEKNHIKTGRSLGNSPEKLAADHQVEVFRKFPNISHHTRWYPMVPQS